MALRQVIQLGDPLLRQPCEPIKDPTSAQVADLIQDLGDTLAHWKAQTGYGRGIAAPQIGVLQRAIFLNLDGQSPWPLINPRIVAHSQDTMEVWDGCLSFLSIFCKVIRHCQITVEYQHLDGRTDTRQASGDLSELLQHEIDHLDGVLTLDRITDIETICTRQEFEKRHRHTSPYA